MLDVSGYADDVAAAALGGRCARCGAIGANARPNWQERAAPLKYDLQKLRPECSSWKKAASQSMRPFLSDSLSSHTACSRRSLRNSSDLFDHAASAAACRLLRQRSRPKPPRAEAKRVSVPGNGVADSGAPGTVPKA